MEYCCTLKNERCTRRSALENLKTLCQLKEAGDICSLFMTVYVKCLEWASHRKQSSGCQCWGWGVRRWKGMVSAKGRKCSTFVTRLIGQVCEKKTHGDGYFSRRRLCYVNYKLLFKDTHGALSSGTQRWPSDSCWWQQGGGATASRETAAQETPAVSNFSLSYICCFLELLTQCTSCPNRNAFYVLLQRLNWEINSPIAFLQKEMS